MSFEFAERFWHVANDNGGQPKRRVEEPSIRSAADPTNFRLTHTRPRHTAERRIAAILIALEATQHYAVDY